MALVVIIVVVGQSLANILGRKWAIGFEKEKDVGSREMHMRYRLLGKSGFRGLRRRLALRLAITLLPMYY
jgi:hypothetical protein